MADGDRHANDLSDAVTVGKPGGDESCSGVEVEVVNDEAEPVPNGHGGYLVITKPWPAMLRTIWGDDQLHRHYWSRFPEMYFAGDGAKKDEDGDIWLLGRVDDVMNVLPPDVYHGDRISAGVASESRGGGGRGATDPMTGQAIVAFVILRADAGEGGDEVVQELRTHVAKEIGAIAKPRQIMVVEELPKTVRARSCAGCSATSPRTGARRCDHSDGLLRNELDQGESVHSQGDCGLAQPRREPPSSKKIQRCCSRMGISVPSYGERSTKPRER